MPTSTELVLRDLFRQPLEAESALMTRDVLRARVYAAEQQVTTALSRHGQTIDFFGSRLTPPLEQRFRTLEQVRRFVAGVLNDHRVTSAWGFLPTVRVRSRSGESMAHYEYETATIAMPLSSEWAMRELVVLHEIAHHIVVAGIDAELAPHGVEFASTYVTLVSWFIGPEAALLLTAAFDASGVSINATVRQ